MPVGVRRKVKVKYEVAVGPAPELLPWLPTELWVSVMSSVTHPGPLLRINKFFYHNVFQQWKQDPQYVADFFTRSKLPFDKVLGQTLFRNADAQSQAEIVRIFVKTCKEWQGPVQWASTNRSTRVLRAALSVCGGARVFRAFITKSGSFGILAPVHVACSKGHISVVQFMLRYAGRAVLKAADLYRRTPLHHACISGHLHVAYTLLNHGAKVDVFDFQRRAPLHYACAGGHVAVVKLLLKCQADIHQRAKEWWTAMHFAAAAGKADVLELLLEHVDSVDVRADDGQTPLHVACKPSLTCPVSRSAGQQARIVSMLLRRGADPNISDGTKNNALHHACRAGDREVVQLLCDNSADVKAVDMYDAHPLYYACEAGHLGVVELLLGLDMDVNHCNCAGRTALHGACGKGHLEVVKMLTQHGADIHMLDALGMGPLHLACVSGSADLVALLMQQGADVELPDYNGLSPIHHTCGQQGQDVLRHDRGRAAVVQLLLRSGLGVHVMDQNGLTPLHHACAMGNYRVAKVLLQHGADPWSSDPRGMRPVHFARRAGAFRLSQLLLKYELKQRKQHSGNDAPEVTCAGGKVDGVVDGKVGHDSTGEPGDASRDPGRGQRRMRVSHPSSVDAPDEPSFDSSLSSDCDDDKGSEASSEDGDGDSSDSDDEDSSDEEHDMPQFYEHHHRRRLNSRYLNRQLLKAAAYGLWSTTCSFLPYADVNAGDATHMTPLHHVCALGHQEMVQLLLDHDARADALDCDDMTPLHHAAVCGHVDIVEQLLLFCETNSVAVDRKRVADLLVAAHLAGQLPPLLNVDDHLESRPALHHAAYKGLLATARLLVSEGADVDAEDEGGLTPLQHACSEGHHKAAELLLQHGANVDCSDPDHSTPLHIACSEGHIEVVEVLLRHGANLDCVDEDQNRPLDIACESDSVVMVELLLRHGAAVTPEDRARIINMLSFTFYDELPEAASMLHVASYGGWVHVAGLILQGGAEVDSRDADGFTPLHHVCGLEAREGVVGLLLANGASVHVVNARQDTPLHDACWFGCVGNVEILLGQGADANAIGWQGRTPLHCAVSEGYVGVVEVLMKHGVAASLAVKDSRGLTPVETAQTLGHEMITRLLAGGAPEGGTAMLGGT